MSVLDAEPLRPLGKDGLTVAPVALGCWPMAGVTTLNVSDGSSISTIHAALDSGVNHFDNAFVYGPNGESERLLGQALADRREQAIVATKGGIHYEGGEMTQDARPETLTTQCEESLRRLQTEHVELLYLHSPDPAVPIEDSAGALLELQQAGKASLIGASNCSLEQIQRFHSVCPLAAVQLPYNMLQRGIEQETLPWCRSHGVAVMTYWPLMKGLLADRLPRDGRLAADDKRRSYPMYQGEEWQRNQQFLADLRTIARQCARTVAQLVINWTMNQPGITAVLCGAKRPWQIEETAGAMGWQLSREQQVEIDNALARRGEAVVNRRFT